MNFLAHSALAFDDPALLAGQFAGDFVRGTDLSAFPPRIARGIRLHRRVDAFTDHHPAVVEARGTFEPALRRHAGIIVDVVFDHLLARDWPAPAGRDLGAHARWVDSALHVHREALPDTLVRFADHVRRTRLLEIATDIAAIGETLERLSRRSPRMAPLALAAGRVASFVAPLEAPFATLWPALVEASAARLETLERDGDGDGGGHGGGHGGGRPGKETGRGRDDAATTYGRAGSTE